MKNKYLFDVVVRHEGYKDEFSVVAVDDVDARNQALALDKKNNGKDYKEVKLLFCEISMVRHIS